MLVISNHAQWSGINASDIENKRSSGQIDIIENKRVKSHLEFNEELQLLKFSIKLTFLIWAQYAERNKRFIQMFIF